MAAKDDFLSSLRAERLLPLLLREAMRIRSPRQRFTHHRSSRHDALLTASLPLIVSTTFKGEGDFLLPLINNNIAFAGEENTDSSGQVIQNPQDLTMVSSVSTARQRRPLPTAATAGQIITLINSSITSKFHRVTRKTW